MYIIQRKNKGDTFWRDSHYAPFDSEYEAQQELKLLNEFQLRCNDYRIIKRRIIDEEILFYETF